MREINFRAWNKELKCYISDSFLDQLFLRKDGRVFWWSAEKHFEDITNKIDIQFSTGLKDKNGKEDWIDDIVETKVGQFTYRRKIFQADSGAYCINLPCIGATGKEDAIMLITCKHVNIGNRFDHPELMEPK